MVADDSNLGNCTLLLTGYLRACNLSVNQLVSTPTIGLPWLHDYTAMPNYPLCQVHVSGAGDFQLSKIEVLKDPFPLNPRKRQDVMDSDDVHTEVVAFPH